MPTLKKKSNSSETALLLVALQGIALATAGVCVALVGVLRYAPAPHWYTKVFGWFLALVGLGMVSNRHRDKPYEGVRAAVFFCGVAAGLALVFSFAYDPIDRWARASLRLGWPTPSTDRELVQLDTELDRAILDKDVPGVKALLQALPKRAVKSTLEERWPVVLSSSDPIRIELTETFLDHGVDPNLRFKYMHDSAESALGFSLEEGAFGLAGFLLARGAAVDPPIPTAGLPTTTSQSVGAPLPPPATTGPTSQLTTHRPRTGGPISSRNLPEQYGMDRYEDYQDRSPPSRLLNRFVAKSNLPVVKFLVDHGAAIDRPSSEMPLWIAVTHGDGDMVDYLLSKGASPKVQGPDGRDLLACLEKSEASPSAKSRIRKAMKTAGL